MKATKIIVTAMLAFMSGMTATAAVENPSVGTRVDYINAKGERFFSTMIQSWLSGELSLFEIYDSDNGWKVSTSQTMDDNTYADTVRFVPWGTETYSVSLDTEVPAQYYIKPAKKQKAERLKENSQINFSALCGDTIVFEMDLPDDAFPKIEILYEYTQISPDGEESWLSMSKVPFSNFYPFWASSWYTDPDHVQALPYLIEGDSFATPLPANDKCNNRWGFEYIMGNEPISIKIGYGYADNKQLTRTVHDILYWTLYTQHRNENFNGNSGENWILRYFGEGMSAEQINNLAMSDAKYFTGMRSLLSSRGVLDEIPWVNYYMGIMLSNLLLDNLDVFISATETERNIAKAQLLSLRAHCYTRILQIYGKRWSESENGNALCAPLILDINDIQKPLATMADIKKQCENDLNEAIRIFGNANYRQSTLIEPDLNVARGLLMRLALWANDWQTARDMARQLVADVPLSTNKDMLSGFYTRTDSWIWGASTYFSDDDAYHQIYYWSPQSYDACNGIYGYHWGIGPSAIDRDLWLRIPEKDMRRNLFVMPELMTTALNNIARWYELSSYDSIERLFLKKSYADKVRSIYQESRPEVNAFIFNDGNSYDPFQYIDIPYGAQLKFWGTGSGYGYDINNKDGGTLFMRSDEALLTQAEACWHLGEEGTARELLTKLNSIRNEDYSCTATGQNLLDEIRLYRSIELWGEGFSWFDWKRWNLPINRNLWKEGDATSGNWPKDVTANVETTAANGWRALIPAYYTKQNPNIDISKMGYVNATGYDETQPTTNATHAKVSYKAFSKDMIPSKEIQPALQK